MVGCILRLCTPNEIYPEWYAIGIYIDPYGSDCMGGVGGLMILLILIKLVESNKIKQCNIRKIKTNGR